MGWSLLGPPIIAQCIQVVYNLRLNRPSNKWSYSKTTTKQGTGSEA